MILQERHNYVVNVEIEIKIKTNNNYVTEHAIECTKIAGHRAR